MSRTTSIAGVRPLGWLARVRAQCSCLAWACPAQLLGGWRAQRSCLAEGSGAAGLGPITALGRERAMSMRWLGGQAEGGADGYLARASACDSSEAARVASPRRNNVLV